MIKKLNFQNPHLIGRLILLGFFVVGIIMSLCFSIAGGILNKWLFLCTILPVLFIGVLWKYLLPVSLLAGGLIYFGDQKKNKVMMKWGYAILGCLWLGLVFLSNSFWMGPW